ncbi:predicted protein [Histoplasma capsulatum H143]|uniref:Uncharacterized protein n=1 Tax=Ajellomyces capsulatus (strain H143) TaxID=544712 RepID=C6HF86_AJECH|nr:predicted protein [Histoplasma capsulatum H143]
MGHLHVLSDNAEDGTALVKNDRDESAVAEDGTALVKNDRDESAVAEDETASIENDRDGSAVAEDETALDNESAVAGDSDRSDIIMLPLQDAEHQSLSILASLISANILILISS